MRVRLPWARGKWNRPIFMVCVAILFGGVGVWLLTISHAATPSASVEPENGTVSSNASVVGDASASNGKAAKFGSGSTGVPAQCASGGSYLWSNLETCGWPGPSNTGYVLAQCGGALTPSTLSKDSQGIIHITTANTTISCQSISGCLEVQTTGVTIKNNLIQACDGFNIRSGANGTGAVMLDDNSSATIDHNEFNGLKQVHACVWYSGTSLTATYNNCHGIDDGFFSWSQSQFDPPTAGDNFTIQNNYIHDLTTATANGHIDGYQTEGAGNGLIEHNTFQMTTDNSNHSDSAIAIWDDYRSSHDITIEDNLIEGGGFSAYAEDVDPGDGAPGDSSPTGGFSITNIHFTDNKFSTHLFGCVGDYGAWFYRGPAEGGSSLIWPPYYGGPTGDWGANGNTRSGNVILETGENIDNSNPHVNGNLCT